MHTTASNESSVLTLSDGWVDMISLVNISKLRLVSLNFVSCTDSLTYADVDIVSKNRKFFLSSYCGELRQAFKCF